MKGKSVKTLCIAVFSLFGLVVFQPADAQQTGGEPAVDEHAKTDEKKFDASEVIFGHVMDAHEFHFFSWKGGDGAEHHAIVPLPVILYSPQKGFSVFSSSRFEHGHAEVDGYKLADNKIVSTDPAVTVYDFSLTRNVVQMFIALLILLLVMTSIARRYKTGAGVTTAPKGFQNAIEPVITFVRDEVAKPNIGHGYKKYMPLLLTLFFFILINNILGLIPGSANVTGNIAFTVILGLVSFVVIMFSANKHYWSHIFWPPVPHGIKPIMILVEVMSIFTKPVSLIIRLFANMLAGHIMIICLISLIFIFSGLSTGVGLGFSPVSIAFTVFIYFIEILVAFLQAFIFTNLTAVFIGQATEETHHAADVHHEAPTEPVII